MLEQPIPSGVAIAPAYIRHSNRNPKPIRNLKFPRMQERVLPSVSFSWGYFLELKIALASTWMKSGPGVGMVESHPHHPGAGGSACGEGGLAGPAPLTRLPVHCCIVLGEGASRSIATPAKREAWRRQPWKSDLRSIRKICQTAMNMAATSGPMTKPLSPKMAMPPRVEINTT